MNVLHAEIYCGIDWAGNSPRNRRIGEEITRSNFAINTMFATLWSLLFLILSLGIHATQSVLKKTSEVVENVIQTPRDPADPFAWDYDWSFSGIR
jgi:hypothetical protein